MGTRADFYVGIDAAAEWLGSIAFDGYPGGHPAALLGVTTLDAYRAAVEKVLDACTHATRPADGWPWPWDDSCTSDYAYAYENGRVLVNHFGRGWQTEDEQSSPIVARSDFPNMSSRQNVTFGRRSGLIIFG